jgi:hypothetical protein
MEIQLPKLSRKTPPMTLTFYPADAAIWSDWDERDLGFVDTPQAIQCRKCGSVKRAVAANFRKKDYGLRYQTTCRLCEMTDPYRRSVAGRVALIRSDPTLPDAFKKRETDAVKETVSAAKTAALRQARNDEFSQHFNARWVAVRKIIVYRKQALVANIHGSKHRGTGLFYHMAASRKVDTYIRVLLAVYAAIIDRMRRLGEWRDTIGDHMPPTSWKFAIDECMKPQRVAGDNRTRATVPFDYVMVVNPWLLTTPDERRLVRNADPSNEDPEDPHWYEILNVRGDSGRIKQHLYPWRYPEGDKGPDEQTPDWLRPFNGYEKK